MRIEKDCISWSCQKKKTPFWEILVIDITVEVHICVCSFGWLDCLFAWLKILYRDGTNACTRHIFLGQKVSYVARDNGSSHWTSTWQFNWNLFIGKQKTNVIFYQLQFFTFAHFACFLASPSEIWIPIAFSLTIVVILSAFIIHVPFQIIDAN